MRTIRSKQREVEQRGRERRDRLRDRTHEKEPQREWEKRGGTKEDRSKQVLDPSTVSGACGGVTWDEKQGGKKGWKQSTGRREGEIYLHIYLDVCQTRQLQSDREREKERQWDRHVQTGKAAKIGRQAKKVRASQDMQTVTRLSRQVDIGKLFVVAP